MKSTEVIMNKLVATIATLPEVQSAGLSGSKTILPQPGEGDIDLFIYCTEIPEPTQRRILLDGLASELADIRINVFEQGHWGVGDFALINGVETWLMYFTLDGTLREVEQILNGDFPHKLDNYYYPVGRCAMLKDMTILYEREGFLKTLSERLACYPDKLVESLVNDSLGELEDVEDLERAVVRKDVLFYHFALDLALDHFLMVLFAVNRVYFPSRKRTLTYIEKFSLKPVNCSERLLEVVRLGSVSDDIEKSYALWCELVTELKVIAQSEPGRGKNVTNHR